MSIFVGDTAPSKIFVGDTEVSKVFVGDTQVRPTASAYRTFTVSWTETSNPAQFNPVYSDDATGLTAGSTDFDDFFGYSGVRLSTAGVETAEITQADSGGAGKLDITQLGTLTSGDNVMIKFPVRGIKMSKSGSVVTLSITDGIGRESEGYQYYAFQKTGDIITNASTTVATTPFYLGTYLAYTSASVLKSWSGKNPQGAYTLGNAIAYAGNNGAGYTIMGFYQRMYIAALYMMKYGNPDSQTIVGKGDVGPSGSHKNTGGTDSQTNATYGTTANGYTQMKLFGLEDWWGNQAQRMGGAFIDSSGYLNTALHHFSDSITSNYKNTNISPAGTTSHYDITGVNGTNTGMFIASSVSGTNYSVYYCDSNVKKTGNPITVGGDYGGQLTTGAFHYRSDFASSSTTSDWGTRIMYL